MQDLPGNSEFTAEFFDESSCKWMENKVRKGAMTLYRCSYVHSTTRKCSKAATVCGFCKSHYIVMRKRGQKET
jgi:hypothetical protein